MMKLKNLDRSTKAAIILTIVAAALLLFTTIGGVQAALQYSEYYRAQFEMFDIGITLNENGKPVGYRDYLGDGNWEEGTVPLLLETLDEPGRVVVGKTYDESLSVTNSGQIDEYVRVTVYKYWFNGDDKDTSLNPDLIHLNFLENGWIIDPEFSGDEFPERTVLYYSRPLAVGETTTPFTDTLTIDNNVLTKVRQESTTVDGFTTITTIYEYDGMEFGIEAEADGVQTHNAEDAILSAWGRDVTIAADGTLSLD